MSASLPRPIPESYWVVPGRFLAGEYPALAAEVDNIRQLNALLREGFDTFINLTDETELPPYDPILHAQAAEYGLEVQHMRFTIRDFDIPQPAHMQTILEAIDAALESGRKVYLHCWGGIGRTGTTVGCYLVRRGLSGEQALRQLDEWWQNVPKSSLYPKSPQTERQMQFVLQWQT